MVKPKYVVAFGVCARRGFTRSITQKPLHQSSCGCLHSGCPPRPRFSTDRFFQQKKIQEATQVAGSRQAAQRRDRKEVEL